MIFIGRSKRVNQEPKESLLAQTYTKEKTKTQLVQTPVNEKKLVAIHQQYTTDKPKSIRNITNPHSMDWSWKEDTYKDYHNQYSTKKLLISELSDDEDDFSRPSRKTIYKNKEIQERNEINQINEENIDENKKIMTPHEIRIWRNDHDVNIKAKMKVPIPPLLQWENPPLQPELIENLHSLGFNNPLVIQSVAIPISIAGYDVIGISHPGTGKTLAYVIPLISSILAFLNEKPDFSEPNSPLGIVLAPTHELASQIKEVIDKLTTNLGIFTKLITGSIRLNEQAIDMGKIYHIIVSTPGRLCDAIESNIVLMHCVNYVVIDEADKMVDKSLGPQITRILEQIPQEKRLQMYSATMPQEIFVIIEQFFKKYVQISIGRIGEASETVKQVVHYVPRERRNDMICQIVHGMKPPVIVFCNSRESCENCASILGSSGFRVAMIHGGKSQKERDELVERMNEDIFDILVATDVLSRGIDIPNVLNVVNYEIPTDIRTYIHRIGRTGRNGTYGVATSIVTPNDKEIMYDLTKMLQHGNFAVPPEMLKNPNSKSRFTEINHD